MNKKVLIILSGYSSTGVGEQFYNAMLSDYSLKNIIRYSTVFNKPKPVGCSNIVLRQVPVARVPFFNFSTIRTFIRQDLDQTIIEINSIIKKEKIEVVWLFTNSIFNILIGGKLATIFNGPLIVHVWDSPEYLLKKAYIFGGLYKQIMNAYGTIMSTAKTGFTVTEFMSTEYRDRYGLSSQQMVFSPPSENNYDFSPRSDRKVIKVVFAGSLYAYKEWDSLLDAIEINNKKKGNIRIDVQCIGNVSRWSKRRKWIQYTNLLAPEEAAKIINRADVAYLPYWMSDSYQYFVKTAFPGKMSFYVSAGTPVLFHGPKESSPFQFLTKYHVGISCVSKDPKSILLAINKLLEPTFLNQYNSERSRLMDTLFHPNRSHDLFVKTLESI